jgi:hypothetical protein
MANNINTLAVEIEVFKINTARAYVLAELKRIYPLLQKFVGQKIKLSDGSYSKKFDVRIQPIDKLAFNGYLEVSRYLTMNCTTWVNNPKFEKINASKNEKTYLHIGDIENGVLTSLDNIDVIIERGKLNEVLDTQTECNKIDAYLTAVKEADRLQRLIKIEKDVYKYF